MLRCKEDVDKVFKKNKKQLNLIKKLPELIKEIKSKSMNKENQ